jgi:flagellar hook-associated protein 2
VDAEKAPRVEAINKNISKNQSTISGYAAVKYALNNVKTAFDDLKDKSDFISIQANTNQNDVFTATATSNAVLGNHSILVSQLAQAQRSGSTKTYGLADPIAGLTEIHINGTNSIDVSGDTTPTGVVTAINQSGQGLSAQLVNTGNGYKIMVTGISGAGNAFTIDTNPGADLDFGGVVSQGGHAVMASTLQAAKDASLNIDGIPVTSASNSVSDVIGGVTLNLIGTNATTVNGVLQANNSPATLNLTNDTSVAKGKLLALVNAYNDANSLLVDVTNPKSTLGTYGGTLANNSTVRSLREQLRSLITGNSSTAGGSSGTGPAHSLSALRDIGIEIDKTGNLTTNSVTMDLALNFKFSDTVTLLSGNQENQASFDAGDASKLLNSMIGASGSITTETANANTRISKFKDDLTALNDRMDQLLSRYQKQFAAMDSFVGQSKATQTGLTSTFAGMMAMYTNK